MLPGSKRITRNRKITIGEPMTLLLKQLYAFIKLLNSDTGTNQIAAGLACGMILGFAPFFSLQTALVLFLVFIFRIQLGAAFLSAFFFKFIAFLFDPATDFLGRKILESAALKPLFTEMYNMPIVPFTRFNNSIVMGSLVFSIIMTPFLFFIFKRLVIQYRQSILERFKQSRLWKSLTATKLYLWYQKYDDLYNV